MPSNRVNIDGDAIDNVYSNVLPIDVNGNGTSEYLHFNGHRIMRVYGRAGNKLWQIANSNGRKLGTGFYMHRDQAAVLDLDNDGKDDILHCWQSGSVKQLVERDGATGKEIRSANLPGQSLSTGSYCRISVYYKQSDKKPIILLAENQTGSRRPCGGRNYTDNWARVAAFDLELHELWTTNTCDAGHLTAGIDTNQDGYAEYVFVGKYALDFNGKIRCILQGWDRNDHVDAIRIARLDPSKPAWTAVAIGRTGGGGFDPVTCGRIWSVPIRNPQEMVIAQLDPAPAPLSIMVTNRSTPTARVVTTVLDARGKNTFTIGHTIQPMQNAQLDGNRRNDEVIAMFGAVHDGTGNTLLSRGWYWNLKGTKVRQRKGKTMFDEWAGYPLLFDMDHDGKNELVAWGQSLIVEGKFH